MLKYSYKAVGVDGKEKTGKIIAESPNALALKLKEKGLSLYSYTAIGKQGTANFKKLSTPDIIAFSTQLSQMLVAGLSLGMSLQMLYERTEAKRAVLKKTFAFLFEEVQKGSSLSEGMEKMGNAFPGLFISMVKSGQLSGKLDSTLVELSVHYDKKKKQQNLIKGAMMYPIILLSVAVIVVIILTTFVLPNMLASLPENVKIPGPTKVLIAFKNIITKQPILLGLGIVFLVVGTKIIKKLEKVQEFNGKININLPKLGKLNRMRYTAQFASSLSTLYSVGVNLLDAVSMAGEVVTNLYIRKQIIKATIDIKKGSAISAAFSNIKGFDPLLTTMMFVGEQSGSLGDILRKTSDYFDEEATTAIKGLTGMLQPIMIVLMAVIIGFVLVGTLAPMMALYKNL